MCSAPTLKSWMTPASSVAMLEKLALLKIASWRAPVLKSAASRRAPGSSAWTLGGGTGSGVGRDTARSLHGEGSQVERLGNELIARVPEVRRRDRAESYRKRPSPA